MLRSRRRAHLLCISVSGILVLLLTQCGLSSGKRGQTPRVVITALTFGYVCRNYLQGAQRSTLGKVCVRKENTSPTSFVWSVLPVTSTFFFCCPLITKKSVFPATKLIIIFANFPSSASYMLHFLCVVVLEKHQHLADVHREHLTDTQGKAPPVTVR